MPTAWVYVDVAGRDIGSYVTDAQRMVGDMVTLPPGYSIVWSGQYEYMQRAAAKMKLVIPATLAIIFLLLYFNFKSVGETLIVMALAAVRARRRHLVRLGPRLQLVGGGRDRVSSRSPASPRRPAW